MALFSLYKSNTEYQYEEGKGIASDHTTFHNLGTASGDKTLSSSYTESSLESFAFRANYSFRV
jgi:TonB-dependent starch-binding outer membrane protein SusC